MVHSERRRGRGQPRILYWYRTPPGVKVGRAALDEEAIRLIEQHNPDVDFDWTRILKGQSTETSPEPREVRQPHQSPAPPAPHSAQRESPPADSSAPTPASELGGEAVAAAEAKLGSEGVNRLRGRYAEMLARISERVSDRERQVELKTTAERLNPDAWVTEADVIAGLDAYESTFESLRSVVGHRRRRSRSRRHPSSAGNGSAGATRVSREEDQE